MTIVQLLVVQGRPAGKRLHFPNGEYYIGRGAECQIRPDSEWVSRQHCLLRVADDGAYLRDLGSRNGTLINGELIQGERRLADGDRIQVGPLAFEVRLDAVETAGRAAAVDTAPDDAGGPRTPDAESGDGAVGQAGAAGVTGWSVPHGQEVPFEQAGLQHLPGLLIRPFIEGLLLESGRLRQAGDRTQEKGAGGRRGVVGRLGRRRGKEAFGKHGAFLVSRGVRGAPDGTGAYEVASSGNPAEARREAGRASEKVRSGAVKPLQWACASVYNPKVFGRRGKRSPVAEAPEDDPGAKGVTRRRSPKCPAR